MKLRLSKTLIAALLLSVSTHASTFCEKQLLNQPLADNYSVEISEVTEDVDGNAIRLGRVGDTTPSTRVRTDQVKWNRMKDDAYTELLSKLVKPGLLKRWEGKRFKLSELITNKDREVIWGMEINHWYVAMKDNAPDSTWTRVDYIVSKGKFLVRSGADAIGEGIFFRVQDVSSEDLQVLSDFFGTQKQYFSCAEATCVALSQIGIRAGGDGEKIPSTTEEVLKRFVAEGFKRDGAVADKAEVISTSESPLQQQVDEAVLTSQMVRGLRNGKIKSFLCVFRYGARTVLRSVLLRLK